jgi:hypothetical protein
MRHLRPRGARASQLVPRPRRELDVQVQARRRDSTHKLLRLRDGAAGGFHSGELSFVRSMPPLRGARMCARMCPPIIIYPHTFHRFFPSPFFRRLPG